MADYASRVSKICFNACIALNLSLAKDTGILQTLIDSKESLTSQAIADARALKERYVREIVNCLVTAEILHASRNEAGVLLYYLEDSDKQAFKSPLLPLTAFPGVLGSRYDEMRTCVTKNGPYGLRYCERVHEVIDEFSIYQMDDYVTKILTSVDGLRAKLDAGIEVIEFGSGSGRLLAKFATMFPKSTFITSDYLPEIVSRLEAKWSHIPNIKYQVDNLCSLPDKPTKQYEWIFCVDVIHDLPDPHAALRGIRKLLKEPDGVFTFVDMATSGCPLEDKGNLEVASYYGTSTFLCVPESFQRDDSIALGACAGKKTILNAATTAGFKVDALGLEDTQALYICRP